MDVFKAYQPLIGAMVALLAALIGFAGVIYSQRRIAMVAEDGRAHQEKMAREQAVRSRRGEREAFANALLGELSALQFSLDNASSTLSAQIAIAEELARMGTSRKTQPRVVFRFATPVFDSLAAKIGLLPPPLSFEVSKLYGQFKSYSIQTQDQVPEMEAQLAVRVMKSVQESLLGLSKEAEALKNALSLDEAGNPGPNQN